MTEVRQPRSEAGRKLLAGFPSERMRVAILAIEDDFTQGPNAVLRQPSGTDPGVGEPPQGSTSSEAAPLLISTPGWTLCPVCEHPLPVAAAESGERLIRQHERIEFAARVEERVRLHADGFGDISVKVVSLIVREEALQ